MVELRDASARGDLESPVFYLGTHEPSWLSHVQVPLFLSRRRLSRLRHKMPRRPPACGWALDSGGFTELNLFGQWQTTPEQYVREVHRWDQEIGDLDWAAPQDWMCEPQVRAKTGLTVAEHQRRSTLSWLTLSDLWWRISDEENPFMFTLQGDGPGSHASHREQAERAGVDLVNMPLVAVGSVCRLQQTSAIGRILDELGDDLALHGFGVKSDGLRNYGDRFASADSLAWSRGGRSVPGCGRVGPTGRTHATEANCLHYALQWRGRVLDAAAGWRGDGGLGRAAPVSRRGAGRAGLTRLDFSRCQPVPRRAAQR